MQSKELAKLIGPTLVVMSISEIVNMKIWMTNVPAITYLNGIILFVTGLSVVRIHNLWTCSWRLIITLLGWGAIAVGMFRIFLPDAKQGGHNALTYLVVITLLLIGLFLSYKGYSSEKSKS